MNKEQLIALYNSQGDNARLLREKFFIDRQTLNSNDPGYIDSNLEYSDELYAEHIGMEALSANDPMSYNQYLINIQNRLARIDYRLIKGSRKSLFDYYIKEPVPQGDTVSLQYTDIEQLSTYNINKYVPDKTRGGSLVKDQYASLSTIPDEGIKINGITVLNPDKWLAYKVVPEAIIEQAMISNITSGMANGWPSIIDEQIEREVYRHEFNRQLELMRRTGYMPDNKAWMDPRTKWSKNLKSFVTVDYEIKDEKSFMSFLVDIYSVAAKLEGDYYTDYNPAGISQICPMAKQTLFLHSSLSAYWRTNNSILFNSKVIDVEQQFKKVEFVNLRDTMDNEEVLAVLITSDVYEHRPTVNRLAIQTFAYNMTVSIFRHMWWISLCRLYVPVIVFTKVKK